jgi:hypothetical protein
MDILPPSLLTADAQGSTALHVALSSGTATANLVVLRFLVEQQA